MRRGAAIFSLALLVWVASVQAQETVEVTVRDFAGLKQAINLANQQSGNTLTRIYVVGQIYWTAPTQTPDPAPIRGAVKISGGIFSDADDGGGSNLFIVESSGKLTVTDSKFVDISHANFGPVIFSNQGELALENVTFTSVRGSGICLRFGCTPSQTPTIYNGVNGKLTLNGVRFEDSGSRANPNWGTKDRNGILANDGTAELVRTQVFLSHNRWEQPLWNSGFLRLQNSSFLVRNDPDIPSLDLLEVADGAQTESVNSVFEGFTGAWCDQVVSLGHNSDSSPECQWASAGDIVGAPTGLILRRSADAFDLVPGADSALVDSADGDWCTATAIFDGDGDGIAACDRGAYELRRTRLAEGGINGFYNNSEHDGNFVYIQQTDYTNLVVWNTFDADGNQVWVYGVGEFVNGRSVVAKAYINRAGGFAPDGLGAAIEAEHWGELEVDMESCTNGIVTYRSELPEFGSGQFPIERLAYVKQLGCVDPK
jgi:hypothetical protein